MKLIKIIVGVVGLVMLVVWGFRYFSTDESQIVPIITNISVTSIVSEGGDIVTAPVFEPIEVTEVELVKQFNLNNTINLTSGSTALVIRLDEKNFLAGNWAEAVAYKDGDTTESFSPRLGTIYSILGDTTILSAHSGTLNNKPSLFASNIDFHLRKSDGLKLSFADGQAKAKSLVGKTAFICQTSAEVMDKFSLYDVNLPCPERQLELKIVAVSLIPQEKVADYNNHFLGLRNWLIFDMAETSFAYLNPKTGFVMVTCVGKYPDQEEASKIPSYDFNRLVIGFEIVNSPP